MRQDRPERIISRPIARRSRLDFLPRWRQRASDVLAKTPTYILVSPIAFSLVATIPLFISVLFPYQLFSEILMEPNLMYHNMRVVWFYLGCIACHILGILFVSPIRQSPTLIPKAKIRAEDLWGVIAPPLAFTAFLQLLSIGITIKNTPGLIHMMLAGEGALAKRSLNTEGAFNQAQPLLIVVVCWAQYLFLTRREELSPPHRFYLRTLITLSALLSLMGALVKVARYEAIPLLLSLLVIWMRTSKNAHKTWSTLLKFAGGGVMGIIVFGAFSALRGHTDARASAQSLMGYGPASFNRLAAMLQGQLRFPFGGTGYYAFAFFFYLPLLHNIIDMQALFGLPDTTSAFESEFVAVAAAHLNSAMIWATVWGYLYSDLGYGVFPYAVVLGMFVGLAWSSFNKGGTFGITVYPYCASTIVLWFSYPYLLKPALDTILGTVLVLKGCEEVIPWMKRRYRRSEEPTYREAMRKRREALALRRRAKFRER